MRIRRRHHPLLLAALLLAAIGNAYSQKPSALPPAQEGSWQKALSYTFVSPNTRENLTLKEALRLLNSKEETRLINAIRRLSQCLGLKSAVMKTIGNWMDGAEHSTVFRVYTDQPTLNYEDARLGKVENQKTVLNFRQDPSGEGRMYILHMRRSAKSLSFISKKLDENGVAFRTLVPRRGYPLIIYVVDLKNELRKQVLSVSRKLGARPLLIRGSGEFIGDDSDRDKARQVFGEIIREYEGAHPRVARRCSK